MTLAAGFADTARERLRVAVELNLLRSLARRLSEPWPAEERLARWHKMQPMESRAAFPHARARYDAGERRGPDGAFPAVRRADRQPLVTYPRSWMPSIAGVGRDDRGLPQYDAARHPLRTAHASIDLPRGATEDERRDRIVPGGLRVTLHDHDPEPPPIDWTPVAEPVGVTWQRDPLTGEVREYRRHGHRFRYADGRVEWRTDVDPDRATWGVREFPPMTFGAVGPAAQGVERWFRRRIFAEHGHPDVIEYHEDDPSAARRIEATALEQLREERRAAARPRLSAEGRATRDRLLAEYGPSKRSIRQQAAPQHASANPAWMPSIAGVGPVVLRWPEETRTPAWATYEAIRAGNTFYLAYGEPRASHWLMSVPHDLRTDAERALTETRDEFLGLEVGDTVLDTFARAVSDRLVGVVLPERLTATAKHLGALPRDWRAQRRRRKLLRAAKREGKLGIATELPTRRSNRATLGTLAARYTPRRPDGSYNRHDARRWMRAFRTEALVASDALWGDGDAGRPQAIEALCSMVGLDDAIGLTERPRAEAAVIVTIDATSAGVPAPTFGVPIVLGRDAPPQVQRLTREEVAAMARPSPEYQAALAAFGQAAERTDPATATGTDLDAIAAQHNLARWSSETDERLRARIEREGLFLDRAVETAARRAIDGDRYEAPPPTGATLSGIRAAVLAVRGVTHASVEETRPGLVRVRYEGTASEQAVFDAAEGTVALGVAVAVERVGAAGGFVPLTIPTFPAVSPRIDPGGVASMARDDARITRQSTEDRTVAVRRRMDEIRVDSQRYPWTLRAHVDWTRARHDDEITSFACVQLEAWCDASDRRLATLSSPRHPWASRLAASDEAAPDAAAGPYDPGR